MALDVSAQRYSRFNETSHFTDFRSGNVALIFNFLILGVEGFPTHNFTKISWKLHDFDALLLDPTM